MAENITLEIMKISIVSYPRFHRNSRIPGLKSGWLIAERSILLDEFSFQPLPFDRG